MAPIKLNGNRQLLIDDGVIDEVNGLTQVLNQPTPYAGNPILRPSPPWEHDVGFLGTVVRDDTDTFRAWYQSWVDESYPACYATSEDGIHWHKPELGIHEVSGSTANNRILNEACVPNVIIEPNDPDPARRYKMLYWDFSIPRKPGWASASVAFSPDGIHWTEHPGNPILTGTGDTHTVLGWDESVGKYVAYIRPRRQYEGGPNVRVIGRSVSDDFINWTMPEVALAPDEDEPDLEFYGMPVFKYEGLYLGLPWAYHTYPEEPHPRRAGTTDIQLAVSRDGIDWQRAGDRHTFIPLGANGKMDQGMVSAAKEPIRMSDELWFYGVASDGDHGTTHRNARGTLSKLRLDGFVSLDAGDEVGTLLTKPILCEDGQLIVNADARGGTVAVAVLDEDGTQHEDMRMIDCAVLDTDSVRHRVTWRDRASLNHLKDKTIRLKFYVKSAKLFSFAIE